ncbi:predicted protein [Naegleria gruberi]|uniref:Predicted protein n=1 Tax=Naegleria gruberi TaxID=5762 RepID=D2VN57_NAEGR|nr:uncharacterized protein NAEGRDRAFT_50923 [Naegleria gruberi]EFC41593.1 predicted protein [Naegleria gruberi]|eukprot:XP_002674337.1 predicted protein [Naegleria gruberi strain NEG-M]
MNRITSSAAHNTSVITKFLRKAKKNQYIFFFPSPYTTNRSFHTQNKLFDGPKGFSDLFKEHLKRNIQNNESVQKAILNYQESLLGKGVEKLKPALEKSRESINKTSSAIDETTEKILQSETMSKVGKAVDSAYDVLNQKVGLKYITEVASNRISELKRAPVFFFRTKYARELDLSQGFVYNPFTRSLVNITEIISQEELETMVQEIKEKNELRSTSEPEEGTSEEFVEHERQEQEREELIKLLTARMQEQRIQESEAGKPKVNPTDAETIKLTRENSPVISTLIEPYYINSGFVKKTQALLQDILFKQTGKNPSLLFRVPGILNALSETISFIDARTAQEKVKKSKEEDIPDTEADISSTSENALAMGAFKKRDPRFDLDLLLVTMETLIIPEIMSAYFNDDAHTIKKFVSESCYRQVFFPRIQERVHTKIKYDAKILHVEDVMLYTTRYDAGNPALVISCAVQYIHCMKNEAGEIVEGGPKDIRKENQMWILKQDESQETDDWYVSEVSMLNADAVKIV